MTPMTTDEALAFMTEGSRTGKLAVTRADGRPHVSPIWFDRDEASGQLLFMTSAKSVKGKSLARDGRVSICVDLMDFPFDFAIANGKVASLTTYEDDPETMTFWATETCRRYVGDDQAEAFGQRNGGPGQLLVRIDIDSVTGSRGVAN